MGLDELTATLWRRRVVLLLTFIACAGAIAAVTLALPPTYEASATLSVSAADEEGGRVLDASQSEQLTRTFTALASNPATADAALEALGDDMTRTELLDKMAFAPIERTQLLQITAKDEDAARAAEIANAYAEAFVSSAEGKFEEGSLPAAARLTEPAVEPTDPSSPNVPLYLGFGIVLAALLAVGAALARDRFDRHLRIEPDAPTLFDYPILARIPDVPAAWRAAQAPVEDARLADGMRVLRTSIELAPGGAARTLMITGSAASEGKSTLAAQLAFAAARDGDRVTLIECDLRRPSFDFASARGADGPRGLGLVDYLAGRGTARDVMREEHPGLNVVYGGEPEPSPARLLRSPRLTELIDMARHLSDWVIIDAPPASIGDDALLLTPHVDGVIYVVNPEVTETPRARAGLRRLERVGARILGIVANRTATPEQSSYYYLAGRAGAASHRTPAKR
jgi:capsular exopolysaccharide synthesis family protein